MNVIQVKLKLRKGFNTTEFCLFFERLVILKKVIRQYYTCLND